MAECSGLFQDVEVARAYRAIRPNPPWELVTTMISYLREKYHGYLTQAVDVGCGSGQCTSLLAEHFVQVLGCDVSNEQIEQARSKCKYANTSFCVTGAEAILLPDRSAQLVVAVEAAHWFALDEFFKEVDRVLIPGGVVALAGYSQMRLSHGDCSVFLQDAFIDLCFGENQEFHGPWAKRLPLLSNGYRDIVLPFQETRHVRDRPELTVKQKTTMEGLVEYIRSFPSTSARTAKKGEEDTERYLNSIKTRWAARLKISGDIDKATLYVETPYFVVMARKPLNY